MSSTHLTCRRRSVSAAIISLLVFCAAAKSHHRQGSPVNGCYRVYPEHQSKLKCPHVGYVSAFAEDVFTPGLKLLQGFQHVVMGPDFVVISCRVVSFCVRSGRPVMAGPVSGCCPVCPEPALSFPGHVPDACWGHLRKRNLWSLPFLQHRF